MQVLISNLPLVILSLIWIPASLISRRFILLLLPLTVNSVSLILGVPLAGSLSVFAFVETALSGNPAVVLIPLFSGIVPFIFKSSLETGVIFLVSALSFPFVLYLKGKKHRLHQESPFHQTEFDLFQELSGIQASTGGKVRISISPERGRVSVPLKDMGTYLNIETHGGAGDEAIQFLLNRILSLHERNAVLSSLLSGMEVLQEQLRSLRNIDMDETVRNIQTGIRRIFPSVRGIYIYTPERTWQDGQVNRENIAKAQTQDFPVYLSEIETFIFPITHDHEKWFIAIQGTPDPTQVRMLDLYCEFARDIFRNAVLHRRVEVSAASDPLTGLPNRRAFSSRAADEVTRHLKLNRPFSILMVDVDFFKKVNDTYGHAAGDEVLRTLASILSSTVRKSDIVARYGGEEFILLLPDTDLTGAMRVAEKIRDAVRSKPVEIKGIPSPIRITVSVGAAQFSPRSMETLDAVVERADSALYRAKQNGRDRVEFS
jgi:diguanylate cyclase (GGDEF)-like protein